MSEVERFRLFIAVTIPSEVKARIAETQTELRRVLADRAIRWTRREQFHLTLKFLGDVDASRVEALGEAIRDACRGFGALPLRAGRVGCFPDQRHPRVVWVGVRDQAEHLARLQGAVEVATREYTLEAAGERFAGHVTVARLKGIKRAEAEALARVVTGLAEREFGQWTAYQVELMRSELLPEGARHSTLASFALTGGLVVLA